MTAGNGLETGNVGTDAGAERSAGPEARFSPVKSSTLHPADKVVIAYLSLIAALILLFRERIDLWVSLCLAHALVGTVVALLALWEKRSATSVNLLIAGLGVRGVAEFLHGWYPVAIIPLTYKELTYLIPRIHPRDFDSVLAAIDYAIFGVHPTVWIERFTWPPFTELLQLCYPTYYFLPIVLGALIWRSGDRARYEFWVFVVVLGFYLSYLGYIAVPTIGPRFLPEIVEQQRKPLTGVVLFQWVRDSLDRAEGLTRDCFPSGHTAMTLLVLYYARRFHPTAFWGFVPFAIAIIFSTVYLRYHYVVDVVAGVVLAIVVVAVAGSYRVLGGQLYWDGEGRSSKRAASASE